MAARWPRVRILVVGLAAASVGFALLAAGQGLWLLVPATVVMSLGMAPVFTIGNEIIITTAPPERAGAASALSETVSEFSGALGIAVLGSAGMVVYRAGLADAWPTALDGTLLAAAGASLGGAVQLVQSLPAAAADALLPLARASFAHALQAVALAGALLVAGAAWLVARMLRGVDLAATPPH